MINNIEKTNSKTIDNIHLQWSVHLARKHPLKLLISITLGVLTAACGYYVIGLFGAIAATLIMLGSLADFLFPLRYKINSTGAECKMLFKCAQIRWEKVKRCYLDNQGVKLSPLARQTRLEAFRGVYLRFNDNEQQVIEAVKRLRGQDSCTE